MIIDEKTYLQHYGKKGMRWGVRNTRKANTQDITLTRKEKKVWDKELSARGNRKRAKRQGNPKEQKIATQQELATQKLVAFALTNPKSMVEIRVGKGGMTVNGRDFAENVIGRLGDARIDPWREPLRNTKIFKP